MARGNNNTGAGPSHSGPTQDRTSTDILSVMTVMKEMMQTQQKQMDTQDQRTTLLQDGLIAAQQATTTAIEKAAAPKEQKTGNVSDFRRLQPAIFAGTEKPLDAEQWIVDMTNLLGAARIPDDDRVEVVKIQLTDVARTWWLAEEDRLGKPITWEVFRNSFYNKFFPQTARREMENKFCNLKQRERNVDEYAAEFTRLSRFAPHMVAEEENKANRFQQGLTWDLQEKLALIQLDTYEQVLTAARRIEMVTERRNKGKVQNKAGKRQTLQGKEYNMEAKKKRNGASANRQNLSPTEQVFCEYCKKKGHLRQDCRRAQGLCLLCGSPGHQMRGCAHYRLPGTVPVLPAPPQTRIAGPFGRGAPLLPQQQAFAVAQQAAGVGRGRGQVNYIVTEAATPAEGDWTD